MSKSVDRKSTFYDWCITNNREDLLMEWNTTKNEPLTPRNISSGSNKKVWWIVKHFDENTKKIFLFEWEASINNRKKGRGCPYLCSPPKRVYSGFNDLQTLYPDVAKMWHPTKNLGLKPEKVFPKTGKKVWWLLPYEDPKTGKHFDFEWEATVQSMVEHPNCPFLINKKVWKGFNDLETLYPELIEEWDPDNAMRPEMVHTGASCRIKWVCKNHPDHKWEAILYSRTRYKSGCPYCAGRKILTGDNDLKTLYPKDAAEWDYEKNGDLLPTMVSAHNMRKVWWKCPNGHSYDMEIANKVKENIGCPICSNKRLLSGYNDLLTCYPEIASEWDPSNPLPPSKVIAGSPMRVKWICKDNSTHKWSATISNRTYSKTGCPFCKASHGEKIISELLTQMGIKYEKQYRIRNCSIQKPLPFDFAIYYEDKLHLIEYDGIQHFQPLDIFGGKKEFKRRKEYDTFKNEYCDRENIPLLRIPYLFDLEEDTGKIKQIISDFLKDNTISQEIINFYDRH